ncbi:MAG: RdgB/HAM1 family non-canonical purine NTP pyrophosphatase [Proteobacteria bacterium]|nr:RdgB/HAM1 family non-canonical purine NTP pyrophosphatase [Pseudomonadota bacterium]NOG61697.1 RdgB/HAM1 family non-canonical purine NTP pyrophosphatase [Pseudomonadota bacterium]
MDKQEIVLASNNAGKVREINELLDKSLFHVVPQSQLNVEEVEETGLTFVENALLKARNAAHHTGLPAIADDSGIEVHALSGAPGIYSARYAGVGASDEDNVNKLLEDTKDLSGDNRIAQFVCVMVYLRHANDPIPIISQGIWKGKLLTETKGENGFGYDPIFFVTTHDCTSAELSADIKNELSHRGQALRQLIKLMNEEVNF